MLDLKKWMKMLAQKGDSCVYCFAFYIHHKNEHVEPLMKVWFKWCKPPVRVRCALVSLSVEKTQTAWNELAKRC